MVPPGGWKAAPQGRISAQAGAALVHGCQRQQQAAQLVGLWAAICRSRRLAVTKTQALEDGLPAEGLTVELGASSVRSAAQNSK